MLSELDIINDMLAAVGVEALSSSDTDHPDYLAANKKLDRVKTSVLKMALWFNTSYPTMQPNTFGEILLPNGTLSADPTDRSKNYVQRGAKLFDADNRTFTFETGTEVKVKIVKDLDISEMPLPAQDYVARRAVYEFYLDEDGDENKLRRYESARNVAWAELYREHLRNRDTNKFDNPQISRLARGQRRFVSRELRVGGTFR